MQPIQQLLKRLLWDPSCAGANYSIGYEDHQRGIVRVPFARVRLAPGDRFTFTVLGEDGTERDIPFHRVREVRRDGVTIWQRPGTKRVDGSCQ